MTGNDAVKTLESVMQEEGRLAASLSEVIEYIKLQDAMAEGLCKVLDIAVGDINRYCRSCKLCRRYNPKLICVHDGPSEGCFCYRGRYPKFVREN